ncbi:DUF1240 domain-containing protein [Rahnella aquatilis]|uniref:DUF1240 domain-containing protein n=1 Tax=Rahnella aquatilis TaxID=34038 RepID=UPI0006899E0C|nr:DUF1240 domain-containing protein [Rahnella aquatilis]
MKRKTRSILSLFFLSSIFLLSVYFWVIEMDNYLDFNHVITFSWMSTSLVCIPLIFTFPIYWFILECIYEEKIAIKKMEKLMPFFKYLCVFSLFLSISLSLGYVSALKNKGYISCPGIPSGWMPGTATKYAFSGDLCRK